MISTYFLVLPKPKTVDVPITLMKFEGHIPLEQETFHVLHNRVYQSYVPGLFVPGAGLLERVEIMGSNIPNDALSDFSIVCLDIGISIGGVIFGAIYIAAWNLSFPTPIEQTLWRVKSIISTVLLPIMYIPLAVNEYIIRGDVPHMLIKIWDIIFGSLYVLARAFLLVEIFRTLFYLPEDAYVTTWSSNFPHVFITSHEVYMHRLFCIILYISSLLFIVNTVSILLCRLRSDPLLTNRPLHPCKF